MCCITPRNDIKMTLVTKTVILFDYSSPFQSIRTIGSDKKKRKKYTQTMYIKVDQKKTWTQKTKYIYYTLIKSGYNMEILFTHLFSDSSI